MSLDRSIQSISISRPLPPSAGVGLSFFRAGTNNIIETDVFGTEVGTLSHYEGYGMLSFGIDLGSLSGGFNIKAFFNDLAEYSGTGIGFDIGFLYDKENFNVALKINNISSSYSWDKGGSAQYEENIPTQYMIGFTLERIKNLTLSTQLNLIPIILDEFTKKEELYKKIHIGAEYRLIHNDIPIFIRMGLKEINNDINYSVGFGLPVKISKKITLNCDYALDPGLMNQGISQLFSITLVNY